MAAAVVKRRFGANTVIVVLPADHVIENIVNFNQAISSGIEVAKREPLVLLGIPPVSAETGYGYVCKGEALENHAYAVTRFVEKPDLTTAERYLADGRYLWNAGIFIGCAGSILSLFERYERDMHATALRIASKDGDDTHMILPLLEDYSRFDGKSFDHAVVERAERLAVVEARDTGWSDVGTWTSLINSMVSPDERRNRIKGNGILSDCSQCIFWGTDRLVVLVGLHDICVIDDHNITLVFQTSDAEKIGKMADRLGNSDFKEATEPPKVSKPWGHYEVLSERPGHKVKRIEIFPGARLSLQSHKRRSEHWTTIEGESTVTIGERVFQMAVDQSCHIPVGVRHRISNEGRVNAVIIEVQIGDYLGEDDITRYEDDYNRIKP